MFLNRNIKWFVEADVLIHTKSPQGHLSLSRSPEAASGKSEKSQALGVATNASCPSCSNTNEEYPPF